MVAGRYDLPHAKIVKSKHYLLMPGDRELGVMIAATGNNDPSVYYYLVYTRNMSCTLNLMFLLGKV